MAIRKAQRKSTKIRANLSGPSGSGKTYGALLFAKGLMGGSLDDVAILDTENGSADLYSDLGNYGVQTMEAPFHPDRYIKAIEYFAKEGVKCMIIDSVSHEWDGPGGCLEIHQQLGGRFDNWKQVTPMHKRFLDAIISSPMHMITTTRRKQDYVLEENSKGKMAPKKVGLKEVQRDGYEYELTIGFDISIEHYALASKDRTGIFKNDTPFLMSEKVGDLVRRWNMGENLDEFK